MLVVRETLSTTSCPLWIRSVRHIVNASLSPALVGVAHWVTSMPPRWIAMAAVWFLRCRRSCTGLLDTTHSRADVIGCHDRSWLKRLKKSVPNQKMPWDCRMQQCFPVARAEPRWARPGGAAAGLILDASWS